MTSVPGDLLDGSTHFSVSDDGELHLSDTLILNPA
jgi:hypothetical protein